MHAGVDARQQPQVRDPVLLAPLERRRHRQAGGLHPAQRLDPLHRVRHGGHHLPDQLQGLKLLRQQVLDHVEVALVRCHRLQLGVGRDQGGQEGIPRGLHSCDGLRQREAGAGGRIHRPEASLARG